MDKTKTLLCVGGPLSGKRYTAPSNRRDFAVTIQPPLPEVLPLAITQQPPVFVEQCIYVEQMFSTTKGIVCLWAPVDQTPFQTLTNLVELYEVVAQSIDRWKHIEVAVKYVTDTFKRDQEQGYHTKDRSFVVTILGKALAGDNG